jgi:Fic family protein
MSKAPYKLTARILKLCTDLERILGQLEGIEFVKTSPLLRKENKIKTIQSSLAIEGNTLTVDQVTNILEGKKVIGPIKDIREVQNAISVYEKLRDWKPFLETSFLNAHSLMMRGLVSDAGKWRNGNVGTFKGSQIAHVAPKAAFVPKLMSELFYSLKNDKELHPLILPCLFHYEIEFIHPFSDGNGRMGRLWQTVCLTKYHPVFEFLPVENMIANHQNNYYATLAQSDKLGSSEPFLEFSLENILLTLKEYLDSFKPKSLNQKDRIEKAKTYFGKRLFSRLDYLKLFKTLSSASASRDLREGVNMGWLIKEGDKRLTQYHFKVKPK